MINISIYSVYHKASHIIENAYIKPIQVGNGQAIPGIQYRDNQGINIAEKNNSYCELTAQYWAWKNDLESDYLGIMHYRRFFDFNIEENRLANQYGILEEPEFTLNFIEKYNLTEEQIKDLVSNYDIIVPETWDVTKAGWKNIRDNYINAPHQHKKDLDITRKVISEKYPQDIKYFDKVMKSKVGYFTNMFILKRDIFEQYSQWLFDILSEVENRINISVYDVQEQRVFGYLSERLFNVWIQKYINNNPNTRIKHLRRVFVNDTNNKNWVSQFPQTSKPIVSIVSPSDNNYVPHLGTLIVSILDNANPENFIDFIILDGGISNSNKQLLRKLMNKNSAIQFLDLSGEFNEQSVHMHFAKATFFRVVIERLIIDRDKVLYLDSDMVVLDDVGKLFNTDLNGAVIGAVYDYIMHAMCNLNIPAIDFTNGLTAKEYLQDYLGLKDKWDKYFQAGVILFDLKKLRELNLSSVMIKALTDKRYWFLDQDVLNKYFLSDVKYLEPNWNTVNSEDSVLKGLNEIQKKEFESMLENPRIIHYAGYDTKPWNNFNAKLGEYYFYYLRKTYWYEQVMVKIPNYPPNASNLPVIQHTNTHHEHGIFYKIFKPFIKFRRALSSGNRYRKKFFKLAKREGGIGKAYQVLRRTYRNSGKRAAKQILRNIP